MIINKKAPSFSLEDTTGKIVSLAALKGKNIVLFFYPKDDTPGCTIEAKEFSDLLDEFHKKNTNVFGISKDSTASHQKFTIKCSLKVTLLSDPKTKTIEEYGFWQEKSMYGKKYMGISRGTVLIDHKGIVTHVWNNVKPTGHAQEVLDMIR